MVLQGLIGSTPGILSSKACILRALFAEEVDQDIKLQLCINFPKGPLRATVETKSIYDIQVSSRRLRGACLSHVEKGSPYVSNGDKGDIRMKEYFIFQVFVTVVLS